MTFLPSFNLEAHVQQHLEIPFPPPRPPAAEPRLEPPVVRVEARWEYKQLTCLPSELPSEAQLDALGAEHWELVGVVPSADRIHFYFKRERFA
jgi:hypothetical protein